MGVCEVTNKQKQRQWKQGTKAREQSKQGNKVKQGTRWTGPEKCYFLQQISKQKKMKKSEKDYLKHKFRGLPEDEQRTEILEILDRLTSLGSFITIYAKGLKSLVESNPARELLSEEKTVELYDLLGLEIYRSRRLFKRFENDLEVYIDPKNINK